MAAGSLNATYHPHWLPDPSPSCDPRMAAVETAARPRFLFSTQQRPHGQTRLLHQLALSSPPQAHGVGGGPPYWLGLICSSWFPLLGR
jgi:hypothetical protein